LTLETFGDFNSVKEWIDISIEGTSFGRLWDHNPSNDGFVGFTTNDDRGRQYGLYGRNDGATLKLSESQLDVFLADGTFVLGFDDFGFKVDNLRFIRSLPDEYITATLVFDVEVGLDLESNLSISPEPTTFVVWSLLGTMGLCGLRRKNRC